MWKVKEKSSLDPLKENLEWLVYHFTLELKISSPKLPKCPSREKTQLCSAP